MTKVLVSQTSGAVRLQSLARDTSLAILIQTAGIALIYLSRVALARWMGDTEYGIYEYVLSWAILLATASGLGLPRTVLRFVSQYRVKESWALLRGIIRGSWITTVSASLLICLLGSLFIFLFNYYNPFIYAHPLLIGIWLVPLQALVNLQLETSRALDDIPLAYAPSQILWPVLILFAGFFLFQQNHGLTSIPLIATATGLLLAVVLFQLWLLGDKLDRDVEKVEPLYAQQEWMSVSLVLLLQNAFAILLQQTDIVMVGSFLGPEEAGLYGAAVKTAFWVTLVLQTVNMVAAPSFTMLYTQQDMQGLQKLVGTVTIWIFWPSLTIATLLIVFAPQAMGLFGPGFEAASWELKILVLGQLVSSLCGSVGYLMAMTGHQNQSVVVFGFAAAMNVVLNAIGIPLIGAVGAAIATAATMIVWNIWLSVLVVKYIGVSPSVFYFLFKGSANPDQLKATKEPNQD
jgi:O-antigen/teichoic acid export membrane protein